MGLLDHFFCFLLLFSLFSFPYVWLVVVAVAVKIRHFIPRLTFLSNSYFNGLFA